MYDLVFHAYYQGVTRDTTIAIDILSSFSAGWPRPLSGRGGLSPAAADLDGDGTKEIIVGTLNGLNVFASDGQPLAGFPVLTESDMRSVPAVYDVDRDGRQEIICTNEDGLHVFNGDGSYVPGWPKPFSSRSLGFGYPNPTVTKLGANEDSAIILINTDGQVYAYEFNGDSYFYSMEGYYGTFNPFGSTPYFYGGNAVASTDLTGNGLHEVAVSFSTTVPYSGVGLFESRTGQPAFDWPAPQFVTAPIIHGLVLGDLDGDGLPEIVINGIDSEGATTIWVKTGPGNDFPGWPVTLPETEQWIGSFPTLADLDLDGTPEVLLSYFEFDIASLYILRADGTPYMPHGERPPGEVFFDAVTFGVPIAANLIGDEHPEIVFRSGHVLPNTGPERVYMLDHTGALLPGWPIVTPTDPGTVFSTPFAPLVDDIDGDSLVELVLIGEANDVFVWDFPAAGHDGANRARLFNDNLNSNIWAPLAPQEAAAP
jgi:hypothetical protein